MTEKLLKSNFLSSLYGERLVFLLVILGLIGAAVEIVFLSRWILSDRFMYGFLGNIIFLNTLHALISYRLMGYSVFRDALLRGVGGQMRNAAFFAVIIFALLCVHYYIEFNKVSVPLYLRIIDTLFLFYFAGYLRSQHTAYQAYGLLQNYNEERRLPEPMREFLKKEKKVFFVFFGTLIVSSALFFSRPFFKNEIIVKLQILFAILSGIFALVIFTRSVNIYGVTAKRTLFSLRFLLLPLKYFSLSAAFCNFSCHGVEYFWITRNIERKLEKKGVSRKPFAVYMIVLLSISTFAFLVGDYLDARPEYRTYYLAVPVIFLTAVSQLTSILHFHMDRIFFRFKDEKTLQDIGPLLKMGKD